MFERIRRFWPIVVLALLPLFPLWRAVFLGQTIGPWDHIRHFAPWSDAAPDKGWDVLQADACLQFYVWRDLVFHAWGSGHLPIWNSYQLGGTPLLANSQSAAFYPPHILVGVLHIPTGWGITFLAWFHLAWAGIGTFFLIRKLGGTELGALLGGGGFALSGFLVAWTPLASVLTTVSWIPWCLLAAYQIGEHRSMKFSTWGILAACVAMMILAGHLQFAAYGLIATLILVVTRAIRDNWRISVLGLTSILFGAFLASPQLVPTLSNSQHSHRKNVPSWQGFQDYNFGAIQPFELLSLPDPTLLGLPSETVHLSNQPFTGYWPSFVRRGASYAETAIGLGPLILGCLILGWNSRSLRKALGIAIVGVIGFLLAMGTIVGAILFFGFPGWSATASPGRASVLFVLAAAVLAGTMFNQSELVETTRKTGRRLAIFGAILLLAAAGVSQFPLQGWMPQIPVDALAATRLSSLTLLFRVALGLGTATLVWLALKQKPEETTAVSRRQVLASLGALVLIAVPSTFLIPTGDSNLPFVKTEAGRVAIINGSWDLLTQGSATIPPNLAALFQIHELSGYDSLIDKRVKTRLEDINGQDPAPLANGNIMFIKETAGPTKLAEAGVSEVWSRKPLPTYPSVNQDELGLYRYPIQGPRRASVEGRAAKVVDENTESLTLEAFGPGKLVLRDNLGDNASLQIDGKSEAFTSSPWPSVDLAPGRHILKFSYSRGFAIPPVPMFLLLCWTPVGFYPLFGKSRKINADGPNSA